MAGILHSIKVRVWTKYQDGNLNLKVVLVDKLIQGKGGELTLNIYSRVSGKIERSKTIKKLKWAANEEIVIPIKNLPYGCSHIQGTFIDDSGRKYIADILQESISGELPDWLGSNEGIDTSTVPAPWQPLTVDKKGPNSIDVNCWGRTYRFGKTAFIDAISSDGSKMLTKPMGLIIKSGKRNLRVKAGNPQILAKRPEQVVIRNEFTGAGFTIHTDVTVEFDGMVRLDWGISTTKPLDVDSLMIEISMPTSIAGYLYDFPGKWGEIDNSGAIKSDYTPLGFYPYIWLGNETKGLSWFMESQKNCFCASEKNGAEIIRTENRVDLRIHIISESVTILPEPKKKGKHLGPAELIAASRQDFLSSGDRKKIPGPLLYTCGLQATPVKKSETDAWDNKTIVLAAPETVDSKPPVRMSSQSLDKLVKAGVRTVVLFEHWTDIESHSKTKYGPQIRKVVKDCHANGIKVLLYFGFLISDAAPEWNEFGPRTVVTPKRGYPIYHYTPQIDQSAWTVCLRSSWADFVVDSVAKAMDKFDIDGVYLDGTEYPFGCTNTLHGCGAVRDDGSIAQTYPIFAVRNVMRRLYSIIKSRKPDGQIDVHNSTCMTMPTLGWATSCWNGEQLRDVAQGTDVHTSSWLESFRTEFMGHQWGVPSEFLCYGKPHTRKEAWSIALLHDIPVRPGNMDRAGNELILSSKIWKIMDGFDRKNAQWEPYWTNAAFIKASKKNAFTSLYFHSENGLLAVITNMSSEKIQTDITFAKNGFLKTLDWSKAKNALTKKRLDVKNNRLSVSLKKYGWILLTVPLAAKSLRA
jgi:hypothetical protein